MSLFLLPCPFYYHPWYPIPLPYSSSLFIWIASEADRLYRFGWYCLALSVLTQQLMQRQLIVLCRQRPAGCDREDRWGAEWDRPAERAGKRRDPQSRAEVQQDAAAALPATHRAHQQDTELLGYSVCEPPAGKCHFLIDMLICYWVVMGKTVHQPNQVAEFNLYICSYLVAVCDYWFSVSFMCYLQSVSCCVFIFTVSCPCIHFSTDPQNSYNQCQIMTECFQIESFLAWNGIIFCFGESPITTTDRSWHALGE